MDCIFCKIVNKEIPSEIFYEDEDFIAFLDIQPINYGHSLLVPKKHSRTFLDLDPNVNLIGILQNIATEIKKEVSADGLNISTNVERAAGQIIFHTHFHIIPRFNDDGFVHWPHKDSKKEELKALADKLRAAF